MDESTAWPSSCCAEVAARRLRTADPFVPRLKLHGISFESIMLAASAAGLRRDRHETVRLRGPAGLRKINR